MGHMTLMLIATCVGTTLDRVKAHAYMSWPSSRNFDKCNFYDPMSVNQHCANCNFDVCGKWGALDFADMVHPPTQTYQGGDLLHVETIIVAHHRGFMELRICSKPSSGSLTQDCFDERLLIRDAESSATDPAPIDDAYPGRWYIPPPGFNWPKEATQVSDYVQVPAVVVPDTGGNSFVPVGAQSDIYNLQGANGANACSRSKIGTRYRWTVRLPTDLECDHCVVQYFWVTANSCNPVGVSDYFNREDTKNWISSKFGGSASSWWKPQLNKCPADVIDPRTNGNGAEKFWNCGDIKVIKCTGQRCNVTGSASVASTALDTTTGSSVATTTGSSAAALPTTTGSSAAALPTTTSSSGQMTTASTADCTFSDESCDKVVFCRDVTGVTEGTVFGYGANRPQCDCPVVCSTSTTTQTKSEPESATTREPDTNTCKDYSGMVCTACLASNNVCYSQPKSWCDLWATYKWCGQISAPTTTTVSDTCKDYSGAACTACLASNNICYEQPKSWCDQWSAYKWCGSPVGAVAICQGLNGMHTSWCEGGYVGQCEEMAQVYPQYCSWSLGNSNLSSRCVLANSCDAYAYCGARRLSAVDCHQFCACPASAGPTTTATTTIGTTKTTIATAIATTTSTTTIGTTKTTIATAIATTTATTTIAVAPPAQCTKDSDCSVGYHCLCCGSSPAVSVVVAYKVNYDYDGLMSEANAALRKNFTDACKRGVAQEAGAGVSEDDVKITLSPGSVAVRAEIAIYNGPTANQVRSNLETHSTSNHRVLLDAMASVPNLDVISLGSALEFVGEISITTVAPTVAPTIPIPLSSTIASASPARRTSLPPWSFLFTSIGALLSIGTKASSDQQCFCYPVTVTCDSVSSTTSQTSTSGSASATTGTKAADTSTSTDPISGSASVTSTKPVDASSSTIPTSGSASATTTSTKHADASTTSASPISGSASATTTTTKLADASTTISSSNSVVDAVLKALGEADSNRVFLYDTGVGLVESDVYTWADMIKAVQLMATVGVGHDKLWLGPPDAALSVRYGLVNIAAFLAQCMQETIQYNACDENNWSDRSVVQSSGGSPYSATSACGQLHQSYQDYQCSPEDDALANGKMACDVDPDMEMRAHTQALWYGAPPKMFCAPRSKVPKAPRWDYSGPWCAPPGGWGHIAPFAAGSTMNEYWTYVNAGGSCKDYQGIKAGGWKFTGDGCVNGACPGSPAPLFGKEARTDVEGCCWWGRGVIQTTGVCNFGKLNYYMGKRAADEGRPSLFPSIDFCKEPNKICAPDGPPELKWIAGFFYWLNAVQPYESGGWSYKTELMKWVDAGMNLADTSFIDGASGIVNRGCHNPPNCGTGELHGRDSRVANFKTILRALSFA